MKIIQSRRSIRHFKEEPVSKEDLEAAVLAAGFAPSVTNRQPWQFIAVTDPEVIERIAQKVEEQFGLLVESATSQGQVILGRRLKNFGKYALLFKYAPALIIACADKYENEFTEFLRSENYLENWTDEGIKSTCLAVQNLILALWVLGYGSCLMSAPVFACEDYLKDLLSIPEEHSIVSLIAVGKPGEEKDCPPRKELNQILRWV